MTSMSPARLHLPALARERMAELVAQAQKQGVPPEDYAKQLVEDGLALQREAEAMTFAQIMAPVRKAAGEVDEIEIVAIVGKARVDYHRASGRGKKR